MKRTSSGCVTSLFLVAGALLASPQKAEATFYAGFLPPETFFLSFDDQDVGGYSPLFDIGGIVSPIQVHLQSTTTRFETYWLSIDVIKHANTSQVESDWVYESDMLPWYTTPNSRYLGNVLEGFELDVTFTPDAVQDGRWSGLLTFKIAPEPSTFALTLLSAGTLLIKRRFCPVRQAYNLHAAARISF